MADFTTSAKSWLTQSTTGQGASVLLGAATAVLSHTITPLEAVPLVAVGLFLVVFPQATAAEQIAVKTLVTDGEATVAAFKDGVSHGLATQQAALAALPTAAPLLGDVSALVSALHMNTSATVASSAALSAATTSTSPVPVTVVGDPPAPATT
jgi:hypothetical protein